MGISEVLSSVQLWTLYQFDNSRLL